MTLFLIELVDFHGHKQLINPLEIESFPCRHLYLRNCD